MNQFSQANPHDAYRQYDFYDFGNALSVAAANAPLAPLSRVSKGEFCFPELDISEEAESLRGLSDTDIVGVVQDNPALNEVITSELGAYSTLLAQASEFQSPEVNRRAWVAGTFRHEMAHGKAALRINSDLKVSYGISMFRTRVPGQSEERLVIDPSTGFEGDIRKIDLAFVFAAPKKLSHSDLVQIRALGYESVEQVLAIRGRLMASTSALGRLGVRLSSIVGRGN